mmetsp:Transcript_8326/g.21862  ORF Transcript_8326/g.21862 Transcript_8326/m.21862 type:complete len:351 (+) Transcript_8326:123-1175(+)
MQPHAHVRDAVRHPLELLLPRGHPLRVVHHPRRDLRAEPRRRRVHPSNDPLQLPAHRVALRVGHPARRHDDMQRAHALAVHPHVLREALRDEDHRGPLPGPHRHHVAHGLRVALQVPAREPLVRGVENHRKPLPPRDLAHRRPLRPRQIRARRVMRARVQHEDRPFLRGLQRGGHRREVHRVAIPRKIRVLHPRREPRGLEHRVVVRPRRVRDQHRGGGVTPRGGSVVRREELRGDAERAGAGQRLDGDDVVLLRGGGPEDERPRGVGEGLEAVDGEVLVVGVRVREELRGGGVDGGEDEGLAGGGAVGADAEVELGRRRVEAEAVGDGEDGVRGGQRDGRPGGGRRGRH